ncbi:unnamed protein product [Polarella glacialis]|uniref:EamA domain-containing protein n=1 Tax=Polarella glacialis TaxID=89957 RepID=A0A813LGB5_POLGL|nr:unnamed protein product [Polarella glacialis]
MHLRTEAKLSRPLEPLEALSLQAPACALVAACCALVVESPLEAWEQLTPEVAVLICCSCIGALGVNVLGIMAVHSFGASSQQMLGKLNIVVIMALSTAFMGEVLPWQVLAGTVLVLVGIVAFEKAESRAKARLAAALPK